MATASSVKMRSAFFFLRRTHVGGAAASARVGWGSIGVSVMLIHYITQPTRRADARRAAPAGRRADRGGAASGASAISRRRFLIFHLCRRGIISGV
jgi:hypothetical protein